MVERMGQLDAAARDISLLAVPDLDGKIAGDLLAGLVETALAGKDPAGEDQRLGPRPAFDQATLDQKLIEAYLPAGTADRSGQARAHSCSTVALGSRVRRASAAICLALSSASSYMPTGVP